MKHLKNNFGFGILEVLVASVMMSVIALGIGAVIVDMQKGAKHVQQLSEAMDLVQAVNSLLADSGACAASFGGQTLNAATVLTGDLLNAGGAVQYDVNSAVAYQNNQFLITNYKLIPDTVVNATSPAHVVGKLSLTLQKNVQSTSAGPTTLIRNISIDATLSGALGTTIVNCHTLGLAGESLWKLSLDGVSIYNTNTGNLGLGIGAAAPRGMIDVNGSVRLKSGAPATGDTSAVGLAFEDNGDTGLFMTNYTNATNGDLNFYANSIARMTILTSNGNVGIGTVNPATALQTVGHVSASNDVALSGFTQLWSDNAVIWKQGNTNAGLRFGSANDLAASGWSQKMIIQDSGNVGIGTGAPTSKLDVADGYIRSTNAEPAAGILRIGAAWGIPGLYVETPARDLIFGTDSGDVRFRPSGGADKMVINTAGNVGIGVAPTEKLHVNGNIAVAPGFGFIYMSDRKLKKNLTPLQGLEIIQRLTGYRFDWKSSGKNDVGVIAQDVMEVLPEAVRLQIDGAMAVDYPKLIVPLVQAVKEQQNQISILKQQISILNHSMAELNSKE